MTLPFQHFLLYPQWSGRAALSCREAALLYAERYSWPVFPITPGGKNPCIRHGFYAASSSPAQIEAWWRRWPDAGIGVPTGRRSHLVVLDIDAKVDEETLHTGFDSLEELTRFPGYVPLPATRTSFTGGGGLHLVYAYPFEIATGLSLGSTTRLGGLPGIDVRADGGYIVFPPSRHPSGNGYHWISETTIVPYPQFLIDLSLSKDAPADHSTSLRSSPQQTAGFERVSSGEGACDPAYWHSVARRLAQTRAAPGNRNALGFWLARKLRAAGVPQTTAEEVLCVFAQAVPQANHPYEAEEALLSVRSAYRR